MHAYTYLHQSDQLNKVLAESVIKTNGDVVVFPVVNLSDLQTRKYNEKQSQHKTKLRQAKQVFLKATAQRDRIIQKLENDLVLASSLSHKVTHMTQNESLFYF